MREGKMYIDDYTHVPDKLYPAVIEWYKNHKHLLLPDHMRILGIRTKTKYVNNPTEHRDNTPYWQKRLIDNPPTHYYKHNQHGLKSPIFKIVKIQIVDSPQKYLEEGILHTPNAILIIGEMMKK